MFQVDEQHPEKSEASILFFNGWGDLENAEGKGETLSEREGQIDLS